jgi:hypothetical protein
MCSEVEKEAFRERSGFIVPRQEFELNEAIRLEQTKLTHIN